MKKRFLSILLIFCMVLTLFPATAIADETTERIDITIGNFEEGKTPAHCTFNVKYTSSTPSGITFSVDDIKDKNWKIDGSPATEVAETDTFEANNNYSFRITMNSKGLTSVQDITVNVNGKEITPSESRLDPENGQIIIDCSLGTPAVAVYEEYITREVPFTTTVKQGGNVAPGETTFDLKVLDTNADKAEYAEDYVEAYEADYSDVTISGSVTTNGVGDYKSNMTFTGPSQQIQMMLNNGVFVQQVDGKKDGWTYDQTVFFLRMKDSVVAYAATDDAVTDDIVTDYTVLIFPAICEETDDGMYYAPNWYAGPLEKMHFTNIYTKTITESDGDGSGESGGSGGSSGGTNTPPGSGQSEETEPPKLTEPNEPNGQPELTEPTEGTEPAEAAEPAELTGPAEGESGSEAMASPQTGDDSSLMVWFALLALSAAGVMATGAYGRRRNSTRVR